MNGDDTNPVDQAVFGYSNGHRLLSSTAKLTAIDVYELAAASDLAPGAQVAFDSSYLTGIPLPDSKLYALIRTWLAPEMPRPGCVWSHVLLLDHGLTATQVDLATLLDLHRRPADYATDESFSRPIPLNRRLRSEKPPREVIERVLLASYTDFELDPDLDERSELERAILAVWSQQWPRLRRQYAFRSTVTSSELKGQFLALRRHPLSKADTPSWLKDATADAASHTVTQLRRFLWRYGKDVQSGRDALPALVDLYRSTRGAVLDYGTAERILFEFPPGDAATLKSDTLGLASDKLSQIPPLESVDLLRLIATHRDLELDGEQVAAFFARTAQGELADISRALMASGEKLGSWYHAIFDAILPNLTSSILEDENVPAGMVVSAILERPELLTARLVDRLATDDLKAILPAQLTQKQRRDIARACLQRPYDNDFWQVVFSQPANLLRDGVALAAASRLHETWFPVFRNNVLAFQDVVASLSTADEFAGAVRLLAFPMDFDGFVRPWFVAFEKHRASLSRDDHAHFSVYLLALCLRYGMERFRDVLVGITSDLRQRILRNDLPRVAADWLAGLLPLDDAYWDLNKRLLKLFRKAHRMGQRFDDVLQTLRLTEEEYAFATDQEPSDAVRRILRAVTPWPHSR